MAITQCSNGHYFDNLKYQACPHCASDTPPSRSDDSVTVAMYNAQIRDEVSDPSHMRINAAGDDVTVGIFTSKMDADPVVGWLVGLSGGERGRDHRLHTGRNFIGRSMKMDVSLVDDDQISRENHCSIMYDPGNVKFYIAPGEGTNTYLNGELLKVPQVLNDGDTVKVGEADLVFAAFCKGERKWL